MPRGRRSISAAIALATVAACVLASPAAATDHYLCYRAGLAKGQAHFPKGITTALADRFGTQTFGVAAITSVCTPVDRDGSGIAAPSVHLEGYAIRKQRGAARFVKSDHVVT